MFAHSVVLSGYGNICPETVGGRVFTIIYAFFGIPLALITLIALGGLFASGCQFLWRLFVHSIAKSTSIVSKDIEKQVGIGICESRFRLATRPLLGLGHDPVPTRDR